MTAPTDLVTDAAPCVEHSWVCPACGTEKRADATLCPGCHDHAGTECATCGAAPLRALVTGEGA